MTDEISKALQKLEGQLPKPRTNLSEAGKDQLVAQVGPRTARDIVRAKRDLPLARIPFLFSSLDTQLVVDLLANDMTEALRRALPEKRK